MNKIETTIISLGDATKLTLGTGTGGRETNNYPWGSVQTGH